MKDKSSDQLKIALKKLMRQHNRIVDSVIRTIRNGDLEGKFIRLKQQQLELQLIKQQREQLFDFKSGNILMVHVDYSRTGIRFQIQRRQFNELATFITYNNGNVEQERTEFKDRPKKYTSQEDAERVAAEQRYRAQQRYRIKRQEFRSTANDLQLILIRRLQKTVVTNLLDLHQIIRSIQQLEPVGNVYAPPIDLNKQDWVNDIIPFVRIINEKFSKGIDSIGLMGFYIIRSCVHGVHGGLGYKLPQEP
ncbi:MAG: hypothetical protein EZS28_009749 [Streblomastix strix]|uniref:Uncharacterized protein n=1 Tax=Streblomastix strix TaxID=222440 RepID=A0A5J4WI35_9EUKA|nr:MAG: hypothetical protein EZS28_009749 [Streblomastix strix]